MYFFIFILFRIANSEDPDQTPCSAASDLGLHCLPMSQKWDARLMWVKVFGLKIICYHKTIDSYSVSFLCNASNYYLWKKIQNKIFSMIH